MYIKRFLPAISLIALSFSIPTIPTWAENSSLKTGIDVKEPQKVKVEGVKIENFTGHVIIKSGGTGQTVSVSLKGDDDLLNQVKVTDTEEKGALYVGFDKNIPVLTDIDKLVLTVEMPADMPLDLSLEGGKGSVERREAKQTKVNLNGYGDITLLSVKGLDSEIRGSGEITVMEIDGDAKVKIEGDGQYMINKGTIPHLEASIEGTGVMKITADVRDAKLESEGAGRMELATVTGELKQSVTGAGEITIQKVKGALVNKVSGSAHLKIK